MVPPTGSVGEMQVGVPAFPSLFIPKGIIIMTEANFKFYLTDLPPARELNQFTSEQLTGLSQTLTEMKSRFMDEYKLQQEQLHTFIQRKQFEEQKQRKANDPDYEKKMQMVHYGKIPFKVPHLPTVVMDTDKE